MRLYIGNLSYKVDEQQLREHFEKECGPVTDVKIVTDRDTGQPRGFGFVEFGSPSDGQKALEMNGSEFAGRTLRINVAEAKGSKGGGGGERRSSRRGDY